MHVATTTRLPNYLRSRPPYIAKLELVFILWLTSEAVKKALCDFPTKIKCKTMTVIDTHIHIHEPDVPNHRLVRRLMPDVIKEIIRPEGVDGVIVVEARQDISENDWVLELSETEPLIAGYVGTLDVYSENFSLDLAHYATNPVFSGIRIHTLSHSGHARENIFLGNMGHLQTAQRSLDLHLDYWTLPLVDHIVHVAPELPLVANHMGQVPLATRSINSEWINNIQRFAQHPRAFMKVSALLQMVYRQPSPWSRSFTEKRAILPPHDPEYYRAAIDVVWNAFGEDRLLYASNWPQIEHVGDYSDEIAITKTYFERMGSDIADKFYFSNAKSVYHMATR